MGISGKNARRLKRSLKRIYTRDFEVFAGELLAETIGMCAAPRRTFVTAEQLVGDAEKIHFN